MLVQPAAAIPAITVGGRTFTDLANLKILSCFVDTSHNSTFRVMGAAAGYQVTAGKTLTIYAVRVRGLATAGTTSVLLSYADSDVGMGVVTALTNGVSLSNAGNGGSFSQLLANTVDANESAVQFAVPSGKYLCAVGASILNQATVVAYGYET